MFIIKQATLSVRKKGRERCFFSTQTLDNNIDKFYYHSYAKTGKKIGSKWYQT